MLFASIDIGSNAGRLLITTVYERHGKPFLDKACLVRVPLRLGMDVFEKGYIPENKIRTLIDTLTAFNLLIKAYQPISFTACSTAAMREASNNVEVLKRIKNETGIDLRIISGIEEANIITKATQTNTKLKFNDTLFIDVGGGSTEISFYSNGDFIKSKSFEIGTIRLLLDKVETQEWDDLKVWIKDIRKTNKNINCICSGGNINKLAKAYGNTDNHTINKKQLSDAYEILNSFTLEERIKKLGMRKDRADVIVTAAYIFKKITKWGKIPEIYTPRLGLADGLAIELYKEHMKHE